MKTLHFKRQEHLPILFNNAPRSKALESVCLFYSHVSSIPTQSLKGGGGGLIPNAVDFCITMTAFPLYDLIF